mgnify:CR=1 FL=1
MKLSVQIRIITFCIIDIIFGQNVDIDITKSTLLSINLGGRVEKRNQPVVGEEQIFRFLGESSPTASPELLMAN